MLKAALIVSLLLMGCGNDNVQKPYLDRINQQFVDKASILFDGKASDLKGYHSYTDNTISYKIKSDLFNIEDFFEEKITDLNKMGWEFFKRYNESYIFCDGKKDNLK